MNKEAPRPSKSRLQHIIREISSHAPSQMEQDINDWLKDKTNTMTVQEAFNWFASRGLIRQ